KLWRDGLALECGISLLPVMCFTKEYTDLPPWSGIMMGCQNLSDEIVKKYSELHRRNYIHGHHFVTVTCEPSKFLPYLEKKFTSRGGRIIKKKIEDFSELKHHDLIINCTGLYSRYLNSDNTVKPIRGQIIRVEAPWQFHVEIDDSDDGHYIIPNQYCAILGGTHQTGDDDTTPRQNEAEFIFNGCTQLVPSLKSAKILRHQAGLRPGRHSIKLELETKRIDGKIVNIIHNYGHGGSGVTLCYGCAGEVVELAEEALR
ncbi:FAD dependent oxidoreductase, partial [Oryctes borbonicus]